MDEAMRSRVNLLEQLMREHELDATAAAILILTGEVEALRDQLVEVTTSIENTP